jgi:hypothetical protein
MRRRSSASMAAKPVPPPHSDLAGRTGIPPHVFARRVAAERQVGNLKRTRCSQFAQVVDNERRAQPHPGLASRGHPPPQTRVGIAFGWSASPGSRKRDPTSPRRGAILLQVLLNTSVF